MTLVKICGLTQPDDACQALEAGADFLGMVFAPGPRRIDLTVADRLRAVTAVGARRVGVFVDPDPVFVAEAIAAGGLDLVQLHGEESPAFCATPGRPVIKALRVGRDRIEECLERYRVDYLLVDTYVAGVAGGAGETFSWEPARAWANRRRLFLAGGLTPENVARAIRVVRPYAVDVSSGVERKPGRKDALRVERFIAAVRATRIDADASRTPSRREEG